MGWQSGQLKDCDALRPRSSAGPHTPAAAGPPARRARVWPGGSLAVVVACGPSAGRSLSQGMLRSRPRSAGSKQGQATPAGSPQTRRRGEDPPSPDRKLPSSRSKQSLSAPFPVRPLQGGRGGPRHFAPTTIQLVGLAPPLACVGCSLFQKERRGETPDGVGGAGGGLARKILPKSEIPEKRRPSF